MHSTSGTYKRIVAKDDYECDLKLTIDGVDYGTDKIVSVSTDAEVFGRETPAVGNCVSRTINAEILTPTQKIPEEAKIVVSVRAFADGEYSEWIKKGEMYVNTRTKGKTDGGEDTTTKIVGYDAFTKIKKDYTGSGTDIAIVRELAGIMGVEIACNLNKGYTITAQENLLGKDYLCYIAGMYGGNFVITDDGKLDLIPLNRGTQTVLPAFPVNAGDKLDRITKVIVHKMDGTQFEAGNTSGRTLNVDTPWATQEVANYVLSVVNGYEYQPYETGDTILEPAIEIGDTIQILDTTERIYSQRMTFYEKLVATNKAPSVNEADHTYYANKSRVGGGIGGAGLALRKTAALEKEVREKFVSLLATIGDVQGGMIAYAKDLEEYKEAYSKLSAQVGDIEAGLENIVHVELNKVYDEVDKKIVAGTQMFVRESDIDAHIGAYLLNDNTTLAEIKADLVNIKGRTNILNVLSVSSGVVNVSGSVNASSFATSGLMSCKELVVNQREYINTPVTFANGTFNVLVG